MALGPQGAPLCKGWEPYGHREFFGNKKTMALGKKEQNVRPSFSFKPLNI